MATNAPYTEVFERKEMKYRLSAPARLAIENALAGRMAPDSYGMTRIESTYLDTANRDLIGRSIESPLYKEKLRVRSYGTPTDGSRVFLELKKKYKGIVYKRRVGCSFAAARAYLDGMPYEQAVTSFPLADERMQAQAVEPRSLQIAREIDAFIRRYAPLTQSMLIACDRTAWAPVAEPDGTLPADVPANLRVTFDDAIAYRDYRAGAHAPLVQLLGPGECIMEIKCSGSMPLWLARTLSACGVYKTSFSKYGAAYQACAAN